MLALLRRRPWLFVAGLVAGAALRLYFIRNFHLLTGDTRIYSDIAENWLRHGMYAVTDSGLPVPTLIRLPGYPAILALFFKLFGIGNLQPVLYAQLAVDMGTCFLTAAVARRLAGDSAAQVTFCLAAACPFTANYVAEALTETWAIFFAALALYLTLVAAEYLSQGGKRLSLACAGCGLAIAAGIYLRPDGGIALAAVLSWLGWFFLRGQFRRNSFAAAVLVTVFALAPLGPWALRNWRVFHVVQPLAPRYANAPNEFVPYGYNRWVKTWMLDYVSVEEIYWKMPSDGQGEQVDVDDLPLRAFDSPEQRETTEEYFDEFNEQHNITLGLDAEFTQLAQQRVQAHPLRYYVTLPAGRIADMWLRPRIETLPIDPRWWADEEDRERYFAWSFLALNVLYVMLGIGGCVRLAHAEGWRKALAGPAFVLVAFIVVRSLFLGSLENPEPRYTLECFPPLLALGACALVRPGLSAAEADSE